MSIDSNFDFFDFSSDVPSESSESSYNFFDVPSPELIKKPESSEISEQIKNFPRLFGRELLAGLHSLPSTVGESWRQLATMLQEKGAQQQLEAGNVPSEQTENRNEAIANYIPDLIKKGGELFPNILPNYPQAREMQLQAEKRRGENLPEHGRGKIEKAAEGAGKAGSALLFPGTAAVKAAVLGTAGVTESLDLSEGRKFAANLSVPAIVSLIESIASRRYVPSGKEAQILYDEGKVLGMTDSELAPILSTQGQIRRHGPLAAGSASTRSAFEQTEQSLGNVLQGLQSRPSASIPLTQQSQNTLINKLKDIVNDVKSSSHKLSPEQGTYIQFIEDTISDIQRGGSDSKKLIGTYRNVNATKAGKTLLSRMKEPLVEAISSADQQLAKDLKTSNSLYAKYITNLKEISPSAFNAFINAGELQNILGAVVSGSAPTLGKSIANVMSLGTLKKVSSLVLTNPTAQSLVRNLGRSIRSGSQASARTVGIQFQNYVKENLPDEYNEINWEHLGLEP